MQTRWTEHALNESVLTKVKKHILTVHTPTEMSASGPFALTSSDNLHINGCDEKQF